jgi:hypothetical protein
LSISASGIDEKIAAQLVCEESIARFALKKKITVARAVLTRGIEVPCNHPGMTVLTTPSRTLATELNLKLMAFYLQH